MIGDRTMEFENLLTLIRTVSDSKLTDFKYEEEGVRLHLTKKQGNRKTEIIRQAALPAEEPETVPTEEPEGSIVTSPLVGVFYAAPSETAEPFVKVGDSVKKGQTLAIIEAMKLMNEIECEVDGTVAEIYPENGQPIEYGQPLFCIR